MSENFWNINFFFNIYNKQKFWFEMKFIDAYYLYLF